MILITKNVTKRIAVKWAGSKSFSIQLFIIHAHTFLKEKKLHDEGDCARWGGCPRASEAPRVAPANAPADCAPEAAAAEDPPEDIEKKGKMRFYMNGLETVKVSGLSMLASFSCLALFPLEVFLWELGAGCNAAAADTKKPLLEARASKINRYSG